MTPTILKAVLILAIPAIVFVGGAVLMTRLSGRALVTAQLAALPREDRTPLNSRLGYDQPSIARHWGALDRAALAAETRFLEMDLVFPLAYGGAFLAGLLLGWAMLDRSFNPTWLVLAVGVTVLADWTENLTTLSQIEAFAVHGAAALEPARIALASGATLVKLAGAAALTVLSLVLTALVVRSALRAAGGGA
jgi:hypothetical protein